MISDNIKLALIQGLENQLINNEISGEQFTHQCQLIHEEE